MKKRVEQDARQQLASKPRNLRNWSRSYRMVSPSWYPGLARLGTGCQQKERQMVTSDATERQGRYGNLPYYEQLSPMGLGLGIQDSILGNWSRPLLRVEFDK